MNDRDEMVSRLVGLQGAAFQLASRFLAGRDGAEDVVQQAYLSAVKSLRSAPLPQDERAWFLKTVANTARMLLRSESARDRREAAVEIITQARTELDPELLQQLRRAMNSLDEEHRIPVSLCCEQGLSQVEAALILELPRTTLARRVEEGLEELRRKLVKAGYAAAPAAVIGALTHTAPPVPATLAAAVEGILAGKTTGTGAATVSATVKGGGAMKIFVGVVAAGVLAGGAALFVGPSALHPQPSTSLASPPPAAYSLPPTGSNPVAGRESREEVFEFAQKPTATKQGDKVVIAFASKGKCDATVAIVDGQGKVIRHLASGVLGKNAPWPFKQDSLSQSIEWDGKDDFGKPAPAGCKVRVGLGVKYTYERSMGWDPAVFNQPVQSVVVAKDGTAYVVEPGVVKAFDRQGKYLRTVFPPQGGADLSGGFKMLKTAYGDSTIFAGWMGPFSSVKGAMGACALANGDGQILTYWNPSDNRQPVSLLKFDARTGAIPPGSVVNLGHTYDYQKIGLQNATGQNGGAAVSIVAAPDGETLYFSGTHHAVFRGKLSALTFPGSLVDASRGQKIPPETMPQLFLGEIDKVGADNAHFNGTRGIALDKDGNVYVADMGNNRIQVFKPDGAFLKSLPAEKPEQIAVNGKTGEVYYVMQATPPYSPEGTLRLVKLGGLNDPAPKAKFEAKYSTQGRFRYDPALGLDAGVTPPVVWFGVGMKVLRLTDTGGAFAPAGEIVGASAGLQNNQQRLAVDTETEALYFSSGCRIFNPPWFRFDGNTGKRDESFKGAGWEDMAIGADGTIICRSPGYGPFVVRYDRNLKPLPFKDGVILPKEGGPPGWPADGKVLYCGVQGHSNVYQDGLAVNPANGDIWVRAKEINKEWFDKMVPGGKSLPAEELAKLVDWLPSDYVKRGPEVRNGGALLVWDRDGNPKTAQAITGLIRGAGVRLDSGGNLYAGCGYDPTGAGWFGLADPKLHSYRNFGNLGSIFKFVNKGSYPLGSLEDRKSPTGTAWTYTGHAPCNPGDCGCCHSRFGLDRFGRAYIPSMQLYSIMVLDANGNVVLRLGRYGNADCQGKGSLVPEPEIGLGWVMTVEASDKAVYIGDMGNQRILKAAIGYAAEETVPAPPN